MRTAIACFALALSFAPQLADAAAGDGAVGARISASLGGMDQARFDLAPGAIADEIVVTGQGQRKFAPESRSRRQADGARFGDGEMQYIEGPAWEYHTSRRGPMFEVAALGGGMESAPYLAHVAMNWRF